MKKTSTLNDTQDMGLSIALICRGHVLTELESPRFGKRITFHFQGKDSIGTDIEDYWNGRLLVDAKTYWNESKNLKTRLYSMR